MDARASLADEARVLSAHYTNDTLVNHYPRRHSSRAALTRTATAIATTEDEEQTGDTLPTLSPEVVAFLAARHEDIVALAHNPAVNTSIVPDNLPLKHYFISASHNTYLLGWQLLGHASAAAYAHVLCAPSPARCIEVDVWWDSRPGKGLPIVTHGWTFSKSVPFVDVCVAIGTALDVREEEEGRNWPVLVSLECHVPPVHQDELVQIMVECWGERLVQGEIEGLSVEMVTPGQLRGRIVLMVEYYTQEEDAGLADDVVSGSECEGLETGTQEEVNEEDAALAHPKIADSLAALGFYARSMKPPKTWWSQVFPSPPYPLNIFLNVNEHRLPILPDVIPALLWHAAHHLRRVYPHGLRLTSSNLDPWVQWQRGTHMACLNWQRWDKPLWLNEAMFAGTGGWVVRPDSELAKRRNDGRKIRFIAQVVGVSALPRPKGDRHDFVGYCHAELVHRDGEQVWQSNHAHGYSETASDGERTPAATANDIVHLTWNQSFEWTFDMDPLAFLLLKVVRRHAVHRDEDVAMFCVRMDRLATGWYLVRLLDMRGKYVGTTLLCEFMLAQVETDGT